MRLPWSQHRAEMSSLASTPFSAMKMQLTLSSAGMGEMGHPFKPAGCFLKRRIGGRQELEPVFFLLLYHQRDDFLVFSHSKV